MDTKTAEYNFKLIDKHPTGNFYVNDKGKIVEISKWNLIGRLIKYCNNRNGGVQRKVNAAITETLQTVNVTLDQKQAILSKISKSRGIPLQLLDHKIQNIASLEKPGFRVIAKSPVVVTTPPVIMTKAPVTVTMPVTGFANGGNTCFLAAAMQVLRNIPVVHEHLDRKANLRRDMMENLTRR
jgi:hypothetical protein